MENNTGNNNSESETQTEPDDTETETSEDLTPEKAKAVIQRQREAERAAKREAAEHKAKLEELAAKVRKYEEADLSERERTAKELEQLRSEKDALEATLRETRGRRALAVAAEKANAIDAEAVARLIDIKEVEFDGDTPKNVTDLIKKTKESHPRLFGKASADGGPRGDTLNGKFDMNDLLRAARSRT